MVWQGNFYNALTGNDGEGKFYVGTEWFSDATAYTETGGIADDTWHMWTFVVDSATNNISFYKNGILKHSSGIGIIKEDGAVRTSIGVRGAGDYDVIGQLDEISYWSRTLTSSEINDLYNNGLGITYTLNTTSLPNTTTPIITPYIPEKNDDLKCNATLTDATYVNLTAYWKWYKDGVLFSSGDKNVSNGTNSVITTLSKNDKKGGESWVCEIKPYNGYKFGVIKSSSPVLVEPQIIFNVTNGEDKTLLTGFDIDCNDSFSDSQIDSPYNTSFAQGNYKCTFSKNTFYNKILIFTSDSDKIINVEMAFLNELTIQEHTWLEWLYNCFNTGICRELLENINQTATQIWQDMNETNSAVVTQEDILSNSLSSEQNISIEYTISIPYKNDVAVNELLPIRLYFWFTDEAKTYCYSQDKTADTNRAETPYCLPLVAEVLGPNNGSINFQVDLRPALEEGTYGIVRSIEIDPKGVWTQYGRENLGTIKVLEDTNNVGINLIEKAKTLAQNSGITGAVLGTVQALLSGWQIVALSGIIGGILIVFIISRTIIRIKKR